jgi:hypothetical protein
MIKSITVFFFVITFHVSFSQPGSEIFLFDLKIKKDKIILSNPKNVTNRKGYDNQPFFHSDSPVLYFVSANSEGRTDIMQYNYETSETKKITETSEREYSPTLTPDKQFLSCIVQRDSGAQDLAKYPVNGGAPIVLISHYIVGYHAWANAHQVAVFTLPQPFKLHLINITTGEDTIVAEQIGRSIHKIPGRDLVSFIQKQSDDQYIIKSIDVKTLEINPITKSLPSREKDMAWAPNGIILMSDEKKIWFFDSSKNGSWKEIQIDGPLPDGVMSRLAVNSKGTRLAVVFSEP